MEAWEGEGRSRTKGKGQQMGVHEGVSNGKGAAAMVVSWGHWWQAHWERWQKWWQHGVGGEAKYVFRGLDVDGEGGGKGGKAEEDKCKKEGEEKRKDGG